MDEKWFRNFIAAQKRLELKERAIAYLGSKCCLCGYDLCPAALEFHHLDPKEKDLVISRSMSWKRIEAELKKCELLCSNCHREVHSGYHPGHLVAEDDFG
jgi:hypothetical protein